MSLPSDKSITEYLLGSLDPKRADSFEDRLAAEPEVFQRTLEIENDLVDSYVAGKMEPELERPFVRMLAENSVRAEKVANAKALAEHIRHSRRTSAPDSVIETTPVKGFFAFVRPSLVQYSFLFLAVLFGVAAVALLIQNQRYQTEVARLQMQVEEGPKDSATINTLQNAVDSERFLASDLTAELERERARLRSLEQQLGRSSGSGDAEPVRTEKDPRSLRSITLAPDKTEQTITSVAADPKGDRTAIVIWLPDQVSDEARVSVQLNGKSIKQNIRVRDLNGRKSINVAIDDDALGTGRNLITVHDADSVVIAEYVLNAKP